jgi:hypothetical protein
LPEQYGCQERGHGFVVRGDYFADESEAPCGEAWQTDVWHREEQALLKVYGAEAYMAGIELSSDGTAVNFKGTSLHPMYANLRNRPTKVCRPTHNNLLDPNKVNFTYSVKQYSRSHNRSSQTAMTQLHTLSRSSAHQA